MILQGPSRKLSPARVEEPMITVDYCRNQTNLALKGIIGIEAMSVISDLTGRRHDSSNQTSIAHDYIDRWQALGVAQDANPPHTTLSYGKNESHGMLNGHGQGISALIFLQVFFTICMRIGSWS